MAAKTAAVAPASAGSTGPCAPSAFVVKNIVMTTNLGGHVDIGHVVEKLAHMNPEVAVHGAVVFRKEYPDDVVSDGGASPSGPGTRRIAFLLFPDGRVVLTGARAVLHALQILENYVNDLHGIGYTTLCLDHAAVHVRNMIGSAKLGIVIDLTRLADRMAPYTTYDPKDFSGAIIKKHPLCGSATLLVFKNGCVVVTGVRSSDIGDEVLADVTPLLRTFEEGFLEDKPEDEADA